MALIGAAVIGGLLLFRVLGLNTPILKASSLMKFLSKQEVLNGVQTLAILAAIIVSLFAINHQQQQEFGSLVNQQQEIFLKLMDHSDVYARSLYCPDTLTPGETWKIVEYVYMRLELLDRFQEAKNKGLVNKRLLEDEYGDVAYYLTTPVGSLIWQVAKEEYDSKSDFVHTIQNHIDNSKYADDQRFLKDLMKNIDPSGAAKSRACERANKAPIGLEAPAED